MRLAITGLGLLSGLGNGQNAHRQALLSSQSALQPLEGLLGKDSPFAKLLGAWIEPRSLLTSRKWAPCSMLSLHVAQQAIEDAQLQPEDLYDAALVVGSSRGNLSGWLSDWPKRRRLKLLAASNSMHAEIASAVSITWNIHGPWQVIASGCAASLDALGVASMLLKTRVAKRALVIGAELPLCPEVLENYAETGVLSSNATNDPYSQETAGFFPGEGGGALVLESSEALQERQQRHAISLASYPGGHLNATPPQSIAFLENFFCNSDASSPIGMPKDGKGLAQCLTKSLSTLSPQSPLIAICPHASGTLLHGQAELAALNTALKTLPSACRSSDISIYPLKTFSGHTVGASGLLELAMILSCTRMGTLPANIKGATPPLGNNQLTLNSQALPGHETTLLKMAVGMGGHNSLATISLPAVYKKDLKHREQ